MSNGNGQTSSPLRAVLVGCGGMGRSQARNLDQLDEFDFVAACDRDEEQLAKITEEFGVKGYTDFAAMMEREKPETVSICTPNNSHAPLTIQAAGMGVKGVYCEKPMATNYADARRMVEACRDAGIPLVINHQRRLGSDLVEAKRLIDAGAIGDVLLVRGNNAGDILSDGTHAIDSMQWMTGDQSAKWVFGQIHRTELHQTSKEAGTGTGDEGRHKGVAPGFRYGHVIETGGMGVWQLADGIRVELFCGDLREEGRVYQDYEVIGTKGRIWRKDDRFVPENLFISDVDGGDLEITRDDGHVMPRSVEGGGRGRWRRVELDIEQRRDLKLDAYQLFAKMIHEEGVDHPMSGERALRGFEILMSIYESARTHRRIQPPLEQEQFPLELMVAAGAFE